MLDEATSLIEQEVIHAWADDQARQRIAGNSFDRAIVRPGS
jgi:hypothetical protein